MLKSILSITILLLSSNIIWGQDFTYTKQIINKLCSPEFHGRGFEFKGDHITADYLSEELSLIGVKSFGKDYSQPFKIPVNTFPSKIEVIIDTDSLIPAVNYLIVPFSSSCKGTYDLVWLNADNINTIPTKRLTKSFLVIDTVGVKDDECKKLLQTIKYHNPFNAKGIIEVIDSKLVYGQSQQEKHFAVIQIKRDKLPTDSKAITIELKNKYYKNYKTQNLISYIEGEVDSFIVFCAHYDHLGHMGQSVYFPGANDNASGTVMVLNLAKHYAELKTKPHYSIAFMHLSAEEVGLLGSKYYTANPLFPLSKIKFLFNLDIIGTGEEGIGIVNGNILKKEGDLLAEINDEKKYLEKLYLRGEAANSDHYFFYANGVKAFFIYTMGGIAAYHDINDRAETLPLTEFEDLFRLLTDFVERYE